MCFLIAQSTWLGQICQKTPKVALLLWQPGIRRIKLLHWICLPFSPNLVEVRLKKNIKNKLFIDLHFQLLNNFCFYDYVTNTLTSVQLWAGPFNSTVMFPGSERALIPSNPHTLQPSYPPTLQPSYPPIPFIGSISY